MNGSVYAGLIRAYARHLGEHLEAVGLQWPPLSTTDPKTSKPLSEKLFALNTKVPCSIALRLLQSLFLCFSLSIFSCRLKSILQCLCLLYMFIYRLYMRPRFHITYMHALNCYEKLFYCSCLSYLILLIFMAFTTDRCCSLLCCHHRL